MKIANCSFANQLYRTKLLYIHCQLECIITTVVASPEEFFMKNNKNKHMITNEDTLKSQKNLIKAIGTWERNQMN